MEHFEDVPVISDHSDPDQKFILNQLLMIEKGVEDSWLSLAPDWLGGCVGGEITTSQLLVNTWMSVFFCLSLLKSNQKSRNVELFVC